MSSAKVLGIVLIFSALVMAACGGSSAPATPAPSGGATSPAATSAPAATTPSGGGTSAGQTAFTSAGCASCHGPQAQGNVFPGAAKLSGTALTCDQIKAQVRTPKDPSKGMPPFTTAQVSDQQVNDICTWVKSLPQ